MSIFKKLVKGSGQSQSMISGGTSNSMMTHEEKSKSAWLEEQIKHCNNYIQ